MNSREKWGGTEHLPTVRVSSGGVTQSQEAVINEGLQEATLSAKKGERELKINK